MTKTLFPKAYHRLPGEPTTPPLPPESDDWIYANDDSRKTGYTTDPLALLRPFIQALLRLFRREKRKRGLVPYEDEKPKRVTVRLGDDGELEGEEWDVGQFSGPPPPTPADRPGHTSVWR